MPKMKTHHWVGATLSMKNLFGVVPGGIYGWPKNVLHWSGLEESIADLHAADCDSVQGYYLARPAAESTIRERLGQSSQGPWSSTAVSSRVVPGEGV